MFGEQDTVGTLYRNLASCSKFIEAGDLRNFEQSVFQLAEFFNSVSESLLEADSENEEFEAIAAEIPDCILEYLALPSTKQEVIDALAFEVPKAVARFACTSRRCLEIVENIVDIFVERCTPRDMLSVLCEVCKVNIYMDILSMKHSSSILNSLREGSFVLIIYTSLDLLFLTIIIYTSLQAIQMVIMYTPDAVLRKNAFNLFKKVLADVPTAVRFDVLRALIAKSDSSSMIAILLDLVRAEMWEGSKKSSSHNVFNNEVSQSTLFWSPPVLELVEMVLRPLDGGPPSLPDYNDAVSSALNLYRFILMTEATEKTNNTGILSKDKLIKAYKEWLLPLRSLVLGTVEEILNDEENDQKADMVCAFNPLEFVLQHCIQLVEEKLEHL